MNMLVFNPIFRVMSHKVLTSLEFCNTSFLIIYEAVVRLEWGRRQPEAKVTNRTRTTSKFDKLKARRGGTLKELLQLSNI